MSEQYKDKRGKWLIIDWMDGSRTWFDTEKEATDFYKKEKNDSIDNKYEFDWEVFRYIEGYNNIK